MKSALAPAFAAVKARQVRFDNHHKAFLCENTTNQQLSSNNTAFSTILCLKLIYRFNFKKYPLNDYSVRIMTFFSNNFSNGFLNILPIFFSCFINVKSESCHLLRERLYSNNLIRLNITQAKYWNFFAKVLPSFLSREVIFSIINGNISIFKLNKSPNLIEGFVLDPFYNQ